MKIRPAVFNLKRADWQSKWCDDTHTNTQTHTHTHTFLYTNWTKNT